MLTQVESVKVRPAMYAKAVYLHPESGKMIERIFDMWRSQEREGLNKLVIWAVRNKVEIRIRNN